MFRKKKKEEELNFDDMALDDMDLPPLPSDSGDDLNADFPDMPDLPDFEEPKRMKKGEKLPDLPELPDFDDFSEPVPSKSAAMNENLPELPDFDEPEEKKGFLSSLAKGRKKESLPPMPKYDFDIPKQKAEWNEPVLGPKPSLAHPSRQSMIEQEIPDEDIKARYSGGGSGEIYINLEDFSKITDILKNAGKVSMKMDRDGAEMNNSEMKKDAQFEHMTNILEDIQKKLMIVDKTLFEGGG